MLDLFKRSVLLIHDKLFGNGAVIGFHMDEINSVFVQIEVIDKLNFILINQRSAMDV